MQLGFDFTAKPPEPVKHLSFNGNDPATVDGLKSIGFLHLESGIYDYMSYDSGRIAIMIFNFKSGKQWTLFRDDMPVVRPNNISLNEAKELLK